MRVLETEPKIASEAAVDPFRQVGPFTQVAVSPFAVVNPFDQVRQAAVSPFDQVSPFDSLPLHWFEPPTPPAVTRPRSALQPGRPRNVNTPWGLGQLPNGWGLYRIHRRADRSWYVGISSDLRTRLNVHRRNGMFDMSVGDRIEVILAKPDATWDELQRAEREHIARMRDRGEKVSNITVGGNGRTPNAW